MKSKNTCRSFDGKESVSEVSERIAEWIAAHVRNAGMKGAILGLSGGVDSAVTAALCREALGSHVMGLIMPCESAGADEKDALLTAKMLEIRATTIRLDKTFRSFLEVLPKASRSARANLKARLRMATLYYWANRLSYMVVGTGNRSELMTGYFTKYGDGGTDILPLGGLYKTQVRQLAIALGVPERIVAKPPSAGLWAGQTDEGEMGITYDDLDAILNDLESGEKRMTDCDLFRRVRSMQSASRHKRALPPVFEQ